MGQSTRRLDRRLRAVDESEFNRRCIAHHLPLTLCSREAEADLKRRQKGNKKDNVTVIYTPWSNLKKDSSMTTGQVSYHDQKKIRKTLIPTRLNATLNRLDKTRTTQPTSDLPALKESYLATQRAEKRREAEKKKKVEERVARERREEKERRERGWGELGNLGEGGEEGNGKRSNEEGWDEEDFM